MKCLTDDFSQHNILNYIMKIAKGVEEKSKLTTQRLKSLSQKKRERLLLQLKSASSVKIFDLSYPYKYKVPYFNERRLICEAICGSNSLVVLKIMGLRLNEKLLFILFGKIRHCNSITEVDLSLNEIGKFTNELADALSSKPMLKELNLSSTGLKSYNSICELMKFSNLTNLNISCNVVNVSDLQLIAKATKTNRKLQYLSVDIERCDEVHIFASAIYNHPSFERLYIPWTDEYMMRFGARLGAEMSIRHRICYQSGTYLRSRHYNYASF